jgi:hypothetical protein
VAYIGLITETFYSGGVAKVYADVVQHGGFFDECFISFEFGVELGYVKGFLGYAATVFQQNVAQPIIGGIIFLDDCLIVYHFFKL